MNRVFRISTLLIVIYVIFAIIFFYLYVGNHYYSAFVEDKSWSIDADSRKYVEFFESDYFEGNSLISVGGNFLGPYLILKVLKANHSLIFLFNLTLFLLSILLIFKNYAIDRVKFFLLIAINPMIFFSLLTVNKEIIGIFCLICLLCFYENKRKSWYLLPISLVFALLTRYQYFGFIILLLLIDFFLKYIKMSRRMVVFSLLIFLTIAIPFLDTYVGAFLGDDITGDAEKKLGLLTLFNSIQNKYLYFLIFIPKVLFNFLGPIYKLIFSFETVKSGFWVNFYNVFITSVASVCYLLLLILFCFTKKKIELKYNEIYIGVVMLVLFSIIPFAQLRYMLPTYLFFALFLCRVNIPFKQNFVAL